MIVTGAIDAMVRKRRELFMAEKLARLRKIVGGEVASPLSQLLHVPQFDVERIARSQRETSFLRELFALMHHQRKYWVMPILIVLLLFGLLLSLSGTAVAPFIYTLF